MIAAPGHAVTSVDFRPVTWLSAATFGLWSGKGSEALRHSMLQLLCHPHVSPVQYSLHENLENRAHSIRSNGMFNGTVAIQFPLSLMSFLGCTEGSLLAVVTFHPTSAYSATATSCGGRTSAESDFASCPSSKSPRPKVAPTCSGGPLIQSSSQADRQEGGSAILRNWDQCCRRSEEVPVRTLR